MNNAKWLARAQYIPKFIHYMNIPKLAHSLGTKHAIRK